jgi:predicted acetyltransferase
VDLLHTSLADADGHLRSGVDALLHSAFPDEGPSGNYHARHGEPAVILVLRDGDRIVGHLALYHRQAKIGSDSSSIGMIGGLAVATGHRGRGCARRLLAEAHACLRQQSIPFSILFANEPAVYASSGYRLMRNETHFLDRDGGWKTFVYRGSMYAELLDRRWPNQLLDLRGRVV